MNGGEYWDRLPYGPGVTLIQVDPNGLAALCKPAGVLSLPNRPEDERRSLLQARYVFDGEYYAWGEPQRRCWLLNRLDGGTSGVILVASDADLAAEVRARFKTRGVRKTYQALVFGRPLRPTETWRDRLAVDKSGGRIRTGAGAIPAECAMKLVRSVPSRGVSLLQLEPRTGRSHQLRVQCANRRLPIVGDLTYGDFARNREFARQTGLRRLFLHSLATALEYAWKGASWKFAAEAPLPPEFGGLD